MSSGERKLVPMCENETISLRVDMINGLFELSEEETKFMNFVRDTISKTAEDITKHAPSTCDVGRIIAGVDALQHAKNLFWDATVLGKDADNRKKRKM